MAGTDRHCLEADLPTVEQLLGSGNKSLEHIENEPDRLKATSTPPLIESAMTVLTVADTGRSSHLRPEVA